MAKQTINTGTAPNDRTGDTLRSAFTKINQNFTELYAGSGSGNTGAITFEGIAIVGDTSVMDQGSIELVPNDGLIPEWQPHGGDLYTSWGQYVKIYPTWNEDVPHIHIAAGSGENSTGDLFLGDDTKYVQVNHDGTVSIQTNSETTWEFTTDNKFTFPWGGAIESYGMGWTGLTNNNTNTPISIAYKNIEGNVLTTIDLHATYGNISTYNVDTSTYYNWAFTDGGEIEFPENTVNLHNGGNQNAQVLQFGRNMQAVITGPTPEENQNAQRIIIQGQTGNGTGEGGDVYVWGGDANTNGGDIKIYAGDADDGSTGQGGYVNIDGGTGHDNGGDVQITGGYSATNGGNVFITGGGAGVQGGNVQIGVAGGVHNTIFNFDGSIMIPLGPGILKNVQTVLTGGDPISITGNVVFADANAAGDNINLLLPAQTPSGVEITVKNINSGGFAVYVYASLDDSVGIEGLDGNVSSTVPATLYGNCHATWVSDGITWRITNRFTT